MKLASFFIGLFARRSQDAGLRRLGNLGQNASTSTPAENPQLQRRVVPQRPVFGGR